MTNECCGAVPITALCVGSPVCVLIDCVVGGVDAVPCYLGTSALTPCWQLRGSPCTPSGGPLGCQLASAWSEGAGACRAVLQKCFLDLAAGHRENQKVREVVKVICEK